MKELELYVHIPFCIRKCNYCDFLSAPADLETIGAYMRQLRQEIAAAASYYRGKVTTIFIGGGTPSLLLPQQVTELMETIEQNFQVCADAEITIECNPGTMIKDKLRAWKECGINRLSIGLQSADDEELKLLGRIHTYGEFVSNYESAREIGFGNINVDIISGLPGQKISTYEHTLQEVLSLRPEHISAYSLIIEEGTPFYKRYRQAELLREAGEEQTLLPNEEEDRRMYAMTKELLQSGGFCRYEISNYALKGFCCRHNIGYWTRKNYLGLGLGAASLIDNERFHCPKDLKQYLKICFKDAQDVDGGWHTSREKLDLQAQMEEFMFLGLRMMCGIATEQFREQFSCDIEEVYGPILEKQLKQGLIQKTETGYKLTEYGIDISNYVMAEYIR